MRKELVQETLENNFKRFACQGVKSRLKEHLLDVLSGSPTALCVHLSVFSSWLCPCPTIKITFSEPNSLCLRIYGKTISPWSHIYVMK